MNNNIAICIVTYNHQDYIEKAVSSVLSQKTNQDFKIFISDDASTDNTNLICEELKKKHPDEIFFFTNNVNLGLVKNTLNLLKIILNEGFTYIAMLDGDDYWIDDLKLQKQVNYFKEYSNVGLIHTNNEILLNDNIIEHKPKKNPLSGYVFNQIEHFNVANCTVIFKTNLLKHINFEEFENQGFMSCDYVMYAIFSKYTNFAFLEDFTAVWRRGHNSVSNSNDLQRDINYIENDIMMWNYLAKLFPDRFITSEIDINNWINFRKMNIAFKYNDFNLAKSINFVNFHLNLFMQLKFFSSRNIVFFKLWCLFKNLIK